MFVGRYDSEEEAARQRDLYLIQERGMDAGAFYTRQCICALLWPHCSQCNVFGVHMSASAMHVSNPTPYQCTVPLF